MVTLKPVNIARWTQEDQGRESTRLADCRQQAKHALLDRAALLTDADRLLLEMLFVDSLPTRRIGRLLNVPPGTVSRRARRLLRRIYSPFVTALVDSGSQLTPAERKIAAQIYIARRGVLAVAASVGVSRNEVQRATAFVFGWYRGLTGKSPS